ncbi:MAG: M24 family metallopeptidase [Acidimicrobiales bacterium]
MQLPFPVDTYRQRVERVRSALRDHGVDGLVVTQPDTVHWLSGFDTIGYLWPQALVIETADGDPELVTRTTEGPSAAASSWLTDVRLYDIAKQAPTDFIAAAVRAHGLAGRRIGVDMQAFTLVPTVWQAIQHELPGTTWVDMSVAVADVRLVKEALELEYQRKAAEIADHAIERVRDSIRPGVSETELAGIASLALGEAGSEYAAIPPMIVSGERTALVHALAGHRSVGRGDLVCVELAGVVHRYHAVAMRTFSVGRPSARVRAVSDCLAEATVAAIESAVPGAKAPVPDQRCNEVLDRLDLSRRRCHRIGYSLGVAYPPGWLEPMTLVEGDDHVLAPGMSFTIEPNLSLADEGFGLKCGETIACVEGGSQRWSRLEIGTVEL